jgi:hypothetical protein
VIIDIIKEDGPDNDHVSRFRNGPAELSIGSGITGGNLVLWVAAQAPLSVVKQPAGGGKPKGENGTRAHG